jgi:hypothetical protein
LRCCETGSYFLYECCQSLFSITIDVAAKLVVRIPVLTTRVETKIFVFVFSRKFIFVFREKIIPKYTKITKIFAKTKIEAKIFAKTEIEAKNFRENENFYKHLRKNLTFWHNNILTRLFHNFLAEIFAKIFAKTFAKRKFSRNEISRKSPHFRMIYVSTLLPIRGPTVLHCNSFF